MTENFSIRRAHPGDLLAIIALLTACQQSTKDLTGDAPMLFNVAEMSTGQLVAVVGLEKIGVRGLLRPLAVTTDYRRRGLGKELLGRSETMALVAGISHLYLHSETALAFFLRHEYQKISAAAVPSEIFSRNQTLSTRSADAAFLGKKL